MSKGSWHELSMDFKEGLASSHHNVTLIVVDRLIKYVHFMPLKQPLCSFPGLETSIYYG
jgi:hypothetical protein